MRIIILFCVCLGASGATIFSDSFDSYAEGSALAGQGGWMRATVSLGTSTVAIRTSLPLGSRAMNGLGSSANGGSGIEFLSHDIGALSPTAVTIASFDTYGSSVGTAVSHNSGLYFTSGAALGEEVGWFINRFNGGWTFDARGVTGDPAAFWVVPGGASESYDRRGEFLIVVDGPAGQVYGRYNLGTGVFESARYSVSPAIVGGLSQIAGLFDFRFPEPSVDIDNVVVSVEVSSVPEPGSMLLLSFGVVALAATKRSLTRMNRFVATRESYRRFVAGITA